MNKNCRTCNCILTTENASRKDATRFRIQCKSCYNEYRKIKNKLNKKLGSKINLEEEINKFIKQNLKGIEYRKKGMFLLHQIDNSDIDDNEKMRLNSILTDDCVKKMDMCIKQINGNLIKIDNLLKPGFLTRIWRKLKEIF